MMTELYYTTRPVLVPEISDEQIAAMRHIQPLLCEAGTRKFARIKGIESIDPRKVSFLWSAEPENEVLYFTSLNSITIMTFHKYGAPVYFKPSLAEVYASIMRCVPDWSGIHFFNLRSRNMGPQNIIGNCHWCYCDLFGTPVGA